MTKSLGNHYVDFLTSRNQFLLNVKIWAQNDFNKLLEMKRQILARLQGIQEYLCKKHSFYLIDLEKDLLVDYDKIPNLERVILAQKAGINWRQFADWNSK